MTDESRLEKLVVERVIRELAEQGLLDRAVGDRQAEKQAAAVQAPPDEDGGEMVTLPPVGEILVSNPFNPEAMVEMRKATPARIGIGRAGSRPRTVSWLRFLADHAAAQDAVFLDVSEDFLRSMNLFAVQSAAASKEEFLKKPELGRRLSEEAVQTVKERCGKDVQVQVIVVDGLSSRAVEANIPDLLPPLLDGLRAAGIKTGTPFFIRHGRVWVQDQVARLVNAEVVVSLIGERPGLGTAESMSAYIIYRPDEKTVEADRTVISNIHRGGILPAEAGAYLVSLLKQILEAGASGVKLNLKRMG